MKSTIFLQYYSFEDDKFDVKDYFSKENSYVEALRKYAMSDGDLMSVTDTEKEIKYASCEAVIKDEDGNDMTIDKFVGYYNYNGLIMLLLELDPNNVEEEFDSEFNGWIEEHNRLDKVRVPEEKRYLLEPKRDIKMIFNNLANKETYCTLVNASIIDKVDNNQYVIIVDNVVFTKTF